MRLIQISLVVLFAIFLAACSRAPANVQTIVSNDCGVNWELIPVGSTVPSGVGNPCYMAREVPNYPMAGESNFRGTFSNRVRVNVNSSYDYTITDAIKFISQARFIGRGTAESNAATWDTAESIVIDRQLREVANSAEFLLAQDIVEFNQGEFEDTLLIKLNEILADRGVQLNTFTFVVTPDDQTRNMIDVAAAMRVCNTIDEMNFETCQSIMVARAGAPKITVSEGEVQD